MFIFTIHRTDLEGNLYLEQSFVSENEKGIIQQLMRVTNPNSIVSLIQNQTLLRVEDGKCWSATLTEGLINNLIHEFTFRSGTVVEAVTNSPIWKRGDQFLINPIPGRNDLVLYGREKMCIPLSSIDNLEDHFKIVKQRS